MVAIGGKAEVARTYGIEAIDPSATSTTEFCCNAQRNTHLLDTAFKDTPVKLVTRDATGAVKVETLQTQLQRSQMLIADLRQTMTTGPEIEAELARLNRD